MPVLARVPGKVIAVHVNYRSRAAERGTMPAFPSYFLKPSTTIASSGEPVVRPRGCELLGFEGEIALVIGRAAREVTVAEAWGHVEWVTAANDLGVYDLRYADGGSNVRSKGIDGYTPIGPVLIDARSVDPMALRLRTWVDGRLVQDAVTGEELLFGFDRIVADLSRLMTLEPGDVILTGTPTGSSVIQPGSVVEVEVSAVAAVPGGPAVSAGPAISAGPAVPEGTAWAGGGAVTSGRLRSRIVQGTTDLGTMGAMPRADDATRALAYGRAGGRPPPVAADIMALLGSVSTATLASQLRARGYDDCTLDGLRSSRPDLRMIGRARTVRYLPYRQDLFRARGSGANAQKRSIEAVEPGEVLVIEARGVTSAGTIGDILALRAQQRGATGIVTDGSVRDAAAIAALAIPTYHAGTHPAVLGRRHVPWETDVAVACAGVLVQPGDVVVGDADGVIVVPDEVAAEVGRAAVEQERQERFIVEQVAGGASTVGLYPIGPGWRAAYAAWCEREGSA